MKNINLKNKDLVSKNGMGKNLSVKMGILLLVVSFSIYGVVLSMNKSVESKISRLKNEEKIIESELKSDAHNQLYRFNSILSDLKHKAGEDNFLPQTENLITISSHTIADVVFIDFNSELKGTGSHYEIQTVILNNEVLVKQSKAYKEIEELSNFFISSTQLKEGELIASFSFDLGIKELLNEDQEEQF